MTTITKNELRKDATDTTQAFADLSSALNGFSWDTYVAFDNISGDIDIIAQEVLALRARMTEILRKIGKSDEYRNLTERESVFG